MSQGNVYLNKKDVARLLQEEIRRRIEKRLNVTLQKSPHELSAAAERVKKLAIKVIGETQNDELPKVVVQAAFPPCINALYDGRLHESSLSHIGRFTLTSFLVNIGMTPENLAELFKTFSDYNERLNPLSNRAYCRRKRFRNKIHSAPMLGLANAWGLQK